MKTPTLADYPVPNPRCSGCCMELPDSAPVERFDNWIVVECPECHLATPFRLEKSA